MPVTYSENHHLRSDADGVSAHVAVHLQGADLPAARLFVLRVLDVAGEFARPLEVQAPPDGILVRQTSGPCVHFDPDGTYCPSGDGENGEHQDEAPLCAYPVERGPLCPHLGTDEIRCPVKSRLQAMRQAARPAPLPAEEVSTGVPDPVPQSDYVLAPPQAPAAADPELLSPDAGEPEPEEPAPDDIPAQLPPRAPRKDAWSDDEDAAVAGAETWRDAVTAYRAAFPDTGRTDGAIKARWKKLWQPPAPTPDFTGDRVPVTQSEDLGQDERDPDQMVGPEPAAGKGIYGDARALHADMMDGMMCDRPLSRTPEEKTLHPWVGMQVRILGPSDLANKTGKVVEYSLDPREMLVALDGSLDRVWLPPESLLLIGVGRPQA